MMYVFNIGFMLSWRDSTAHSPFVILYCFEETWTELYRPEGTAYLIILIYGYCANWRYILTINIDGYANFKRYCGNFHAPELNYV